MRLLSVNASLKVKHMSKLINLNFLSCQVQQSSSEFMKIEEKFNEKYNKTLMSILLLQQQMMFQQQQTVSENY